MGSKSIEHNISFGSSTTETTTEDSVVVVMSKLDWCLGTYSRNETLLLVWYLELDAV